jgi:hypothetical protein
MGSEQISEDRSRFRSDKDVSIKDKDEQALCHVVRHFINMYSILTSKAKVHFQVRMPITSFRLKVGEYPPTKF